VEKYIKKGDEKMFKPRTDLAIEAAEMMTKEKGKSVDGVRLKKYSAGCADITRVEIKDAKGEEAVGKPRGNYITLEYSTHDLYSEEKCREISKAFSKELASLIVPHKHDVIFVVGLGNRFITPDALGPGVSDSVCVSRHLDGKKPLLCSLSPGVLGITGIETGEIIEGISDKIKPDIIIAIDALASKSMERICTTLQLADTGITPGAGVGNKRKELSRKTMGIPVIAVGVPTVVDAATVANDSVDLLLEKLSDRLSVPEYILDDNSRYELIRNALNPYFGELIVTPSNIDSVIEKVAFLIAEGINNLVALI